MNTIEHLELHLGAIDRGYSADSTPGVQVCVFRDQPIHGIATLSTLGLSGSQLAMPRGRLIRQELMLTLPGAYPPEDFAKLLLHVAERPLRSGRALLRGDVIALGGAIAGGGAADSFYASIPVVFPEALATLQDTKPPTVFVWLIPLFPTERRFVKACGWSEFESRLEAADPDLFDLRRKPVV